MQLDAGASGHHGGEARRGRGDGGRRDRRRARRLPAGRRGEARAPARPHGARGGPRDDRLGRGGRGPGPGRPRPGARRARSSSRSTPACTASGRAPGAPTVELVQEVARVPGVTVIGLLTHAGHAYRSANAEELRVAAEREGLDLVETAERCAAAGIELREISVGSTPTARIVAGVAGRDRDPAGHLRLQRRAADATRRGDRGDLRGPGPRDRRGAPHATSASCWTPGRRRSPPTAATGRRSPGAASSPAGPSCGSTS